MNENEKNVYGPFTFYSFSCCREYISTKYMLKAIYIYPNMTI